MPSVSSSSASIGSQLAKFFRTALRASLVRTVAVAGFIAIATILLSEPTVEVIIEMASTTGRGGELFFSAAAEGFSSSRSVPFVVRSDGRWHEYRILLPDSRMLARLRIDPAGRPGAVSLRKVEVRAAGSLSLTGERLVGAVGAINQMQRLPEQAKGELNLVSEGSDPFVEILLPPNIGGAALGAKAIWIATPLSIIAVLWFAADVMLSMLLAWQLSDERRIRVAASLWRTFYPRLSWSYLGSAITMGLCLAFVQPIFSVPDENTHWQTGHLRGEHLLGDADCVETLPFGHGDRHVRNLVPYQGFSAMPLQCISGSDIYGDVMTYPGVILSKLIFPRQQESATRQFQALLVARLLQGLIFVLILSRLIVLSQQASRPGVLLLAAIALSPLLAQQAFAVSSDGAQLCFGVCLFAALVFWERLTWLDAAAFIVFGWGAAGKPILLPCIVPSVVAGFWFAYLRTNRATLLQTLKALAVSFKPSLKPSAQTWILWGAIGVSLQMILYVLLEEKNDRINNKTFANVDYKAQLALIIAEPLRFVRVVLAYVRPNLSKVDSYVSPLGWLDTTVSRAAVHGFARLLGVATVVEVIALVLWRSRPARAQQASLAQRVLQVVPPLLIGALGALASALFIIAILYLGLTPVGAEHVLGVQVRYFFPSMMAGMGVLFGAAVTVLNPPGVVGLSTASDEAAPLEVSRAAAVAHWLARVLPPAVVLALAIPYVARVFVDLAQRYL